MNVTASLPTFSTHLTTSNEYSEDPSFPLSMASMSLSNGYTNLNGFTDSAFQSYSSLTSVVAVGATTSLPSTTTNPTSTTTDPVSLEEATQEELHLPPFHSHAHANGHTHLQSAYSLPSLPSLFTSNEVTLDRMLPTTFLSSLPPNLNLSAPHEMHVLLPPPVSSMDLSKPPSHPSYALPSLPSLPPRPPPPSTLPLSVPTSASGSSTFSSNTLSRRESMPTLDFSFASEISSLPPPPLSSSSSSSSSTSASTPSSHAGSTTTPLPFPNTYRRYSVMDEALHAMAPPSFDSLPRRASLPTPFFPSFYMDSIPPTPSSSSSSASSIASTPSTNTTSSTPSTSTLPSLSMFSNFMPNLPPLPPSSTSTSTSTSSASSLFSVPLPTSSSGYFSMEEPGPYSSSFHFTSNASMDPMDQPWLPNETPLLHPVNSFPSSNYAMSDSMNLNASDPTIFSSSTSSSYSSTPRTTRRTSLLPSPSGEYICPYSYCNKTFSRSHNLKSHLVMHSNVKPFQCPYCPLAFRRNHDLRRHVRLHSGLKPFSCSKCGKTFSRSDALKRHNKVDACC